MHFGKPMLVMPENTVEQRVNALALERMGLGEQLHHQEFDLRRLSAFLGRAPRYAARATSARRDGRAEAVAALEQFAGELSRGQRAAPATLSLGAWRFA
jgi:UDP:flavonoid glycosyltransferase YjiC (YdhE family)